MNLGLKGKTAFISGSSLGIGFAIAKSLLKEGVNVIINGRDKKQLDKSEKELKKIDSSGTVVGICADLSSKKGVSVIIDRVKEIDILVNNVGHYFPMAFSELTEDDWLEMFNVNILSSVTLSKHYLPLMLARNEGRIVFISSESGIQIPENLIHYGFTKSGMLAISRGLAELTKNTRVTVNTIIPGATLTEGAIGFMEKLAEKRSMKYSDIKENFFKVDRPHSIINRFIEPKEIADTVSFIVSPLASAINGTAISIDGGNLKSIF